MKNLRVSECVLVECVNSYPLLFREKTALAVCIDFFGADVIELPHIEKIREDTIINNSISGLVDNAVLSLPVTIGDDIEKAFDSIKNAKHPSIRIEVPTSTVTMEYSHHLKADKMLLQVASLCKEAKKHCDNIEFVALDATRADRDFLINVINTAKENGATSATVCDDAGIMLPNEYEGLIKSIKENCDIFLNVKVSDSLYMSVSSAAVAILAGADGIKTSIIGKTTLATDKFSRLIDEKAEYLNIKTSLKTTEIKSDIQELLTAYNVKVEKKSETDETSDIFFDSDTTLDKVSAETKKIGYTLDANDEAKVYRALMSVLEKKSSVGEKEFEAIIASNAMQSPVTYHLESYNINTSNITSAMASVVIKKDDEKFIGLATGDGPIDAAFFAIEQCVGNHYELDAFEIQALTEGKEAMGSAVVRLRSQGKLYSGAGVSSDIVGASIHAYLNAMNKIIFEEVNS